MKKNNFKENLRKYRENLNLSQKEFAEKLDINATTYRNYENSSREPDYDTLIKIAHALDVSIDTLLGVNSNIKASNNNGILNQYAPIFEELSDENKLAVITMIKSLHNAATLTKRKNS